MIQIDLTPDVKQELLKAERIRNQVVSVAILATFIIAGLVIALAAYGYIAQPSISKYLDKQIDKQSKTLSEFPDIDKLVTIRNQLTKIDQLHDTKHMTSRMLDVLATINPSDPNSVSYTNVTIDDENNKVAIEAQSSGAFTALDAFKKTIDATKLEYNVDNDGDPKTVNLASNVTYSDTNYGESTEGQRVLRFKLEFEFPAELLASSSTNVKIIGPERSNATDSYVGLPTSLFSEKATSKPNTSQGGR